MDPSSSDPNVIFIRPPFSNFPDAHLYPEGLTYSLMAANPEWFLDQSDFVSAVSINPNAVPYPTQLEPPRGWCPAKKKDLKALGPDGWPEGEEPRLRCTFCRRTYAGVNAKSMWRRHVYEKHKIAMSNRRDGNDRTRSGRGSTRYLEDCSFQALHDDKENQAGPSSQSGKTHEAGENSKPRSGSGFSAAMHAKLDDDSSEEETVVPSAPVIEQKEFSPSSAHELTRPQRQLAQLSKRSGLGSPLSPPSPVVGSKPHSADQTPEHSKEFMPTIPISPYDPTLTPSFRHSPPRLPSDQPWRFPSPSHPLFSKGREISLSMLVRGGISPALRGSSSTDASPSVLDSPCIIAPRTNSDVSSVAGDSSPALCKPSPFWLLSNGKSPMSAIRRLDFLKQVNKSPLSAISGNNRRINLRRGSTLRSPSNSRDDWLSDVSMSSGPLSPPGLEGPMRLAGDDPFDRVYKPLLSATRSTVGDLEDLEQEPSPSRSPPGTESPVVRNGPLPAATERIGLGIGLMEPFSPAKGFPRSGMDSSSALSSCSSPAEEDDEAEIEAELTSEDNDFGGRDREGDVLEGPSSKRRRTSLEDD
ncbi:hypothetical protein CONPUDRAFT_115144 [Coniophora puteana RWD-64-598 SS2]|uniref:Uncharacterized protein n=1 Tax=Coniophora puteana (strain RWD-64-598) TaxID=741705 RepID=A0A5M3N5D1_CONPW|nr:uncharacterized protein CONPUDRAFT_115144 [Coniophora puteana RWD-64-598 SS2]EIW86620.1 hypothetical protein CONPUDRAFT_115144 [Coniophora puteana RWD-64-598 SS2]